MAVNAGSYRSAVNSNSLALLLQGSGHFQIAYRYHCASVCVSVFECADAKSFHWEAPAITQQREEILIRALERCDYFRLCRFLSWLRSLHSPSALFVFTVFEFLSSLIAALLVIGSHISVWFCIQCERRQFCTVKLKKTSWLLLYLVINLMFILAVVHPIIEPFLLVCFHNLPLSLPLFTPPSFICFYPS